MRVITVQLQSGQFGLFSAEKSLAASFAIVDQHDRDFIKEGDLKAIVQFSVTEGNLDGWERDLNRAFHDLDFDYIMERFIEENKRVLYSSDDRRGNAFFFMKILHNNYPEILKNHLDYLRKKYEERLAGVRKSGFDPVPHLRVVYDEYKDSATRCEKWASEYVPGERRTGHEKSAAEYRAKAEKIASMIKEFEDE